MVVDAHIHVWDKVDGKTANGDPVVGLAGGMIRIGQNEMLGMPAYLLDGAARADFVVSEFNAAGVDVGVVVQDYMDGVQNDYARLAAGQFPGRLIAHALPNYWDTDRVANEVESFPVDGYCGLKLPAEHLLGKIRLDDARLMPIWERLEQSQKVLAVDLAEGESQIGEMENILARCPRLRVAIGHFGMVNRGGWPGQLYLARWENVYLETGGIIWLYRGEGYPFPSALAAIVRAKQEVGIEKLMWGSDWPRTMIDFTYRQSIDFIRTATVLTEQEKTLLLGNNACRLYRLQEPKSARHPVALVSER